MYDDSCHNQTPCTNAWFERDNKCSNCEKAFFVYEFLNDQYVEIRYSYYDCICLSWLKEWANIIPILDNDLESDNDITFDGF